MLFAVFVSTSIQQIAEIKAENVKIVKELASYERQIEKNIIACYQPARHNEASRNERISQIVLIEQQRVDLVQKLVKNLKSLGPLYNETPSIIQAPAAPTAAVPAV